MTREPNEKLLIQSISVTNFRYKYSCMYEITLLTITKIWTFLFLINDIIRCTPRLTSKNCSFGKIEFLPTSHISLYLDPIFSFRKMIVLVSGLISKAIRTF